MIKILFFTSTSEYTGSEIALYNIVNNISNEYIEKVAWVSKLNGKLIQKLTPQIKCIVMDKKIKNIFFLYFLIINFISNIQSLARLKLIVYQSFLAYVHQFINSDIWFINTILQPDVLTYAYQNKIPCVVYAHELEQMLVGLTDVEVRMLVSYPELIIACSETSAQMLRTLGRKKNIEICFPTIDIEKIYNLNLNPKFLREKLGISESTFIWCMSGSSDSNKNPVRFVEIASQILMRGYDCHFFWLGGNLHSGLSVFVEKYAQTLNINHKITWTGLLSGDDYYEYLNLADGFILTSTKECFPLVSLEALYLKKPIVSFDCGGIREIINDKLGYIVKSWNTNDIVEAMIKVMNDDSWFDPDLARKTAEIYAIENQIKAWEKIMLSYF